MDPRIYCTGTRAGYVLKWVVLPPSPFNSKGWSPRGRRMKTHFTLEKTAGQWDFLNFDQKLECFNPMATSLYNSVIIDSRVTLPIQVLSTHLDQRITLWCPSRPIRLLYVQQISTHGLLSWGFMSWGHESRSVFSVAQTEGYYACKRELQWVCLASSPGHFQIYLTAIFSTAAR